MGFFQRSFGLSRKRRENLLALVIYDPMKGSRTIGNSDMAKRIKAKRTIFYSNLM